MNTASPERRSSGKERNRNSKGDLLLRLELPSDPTLLSAVRGAVERLTESFGFSPPECRAVTRAVDEALTNIIRHAYCGRADRPIELIISSIGGRSTHGRPIPGRSVPRAADLKDGKGLEILLCDRGPAIKPEQMCIRALEEVRAGGLGLHFIQESMDVVEYKRVKGANRLRLIKYVPTPKSPLTS
jgi:anti-sigma regulatory factor (Ser/Thr protein kinase)